MDPLSIAASIVALVGAAHKVAKGLDKLASLRGAPAAVLQLNNELSDLRVVLDEAKPLLLKHASHKQGLQLPTPTPETKENIELSIQRANDRLSELEKILQNRLLSRMGMFDRVGWLMEQDKVRIALDDLRTVRLNISAMLGVVTTSTSFRLETRLQDVQIAGEKTQETMSHALTSQKDTLEKAFACMMATQQDHGQKLEEIGASLTSQNEVPEGAIPSDPVPSYEEATRQRRSPKGSMLPADDFSTLRMRFLRPKQCNVWCDCSCHTVVRAQTPEMLQSIFGTLFVGYTGLPALTPACSNTKCRRIAEGYLQVNYYFPRWFLGRIVTMAMKFQDSKIPKVSMQVLNVRDTYSDIFINARFNDVDSIEYQLSVGQASIYDVTHDSGHSPLHFAVGKHSVEAIKVLLKMGASRFLENRTQETPYDMVWNGIYSVQGTANEANWRIDEMRQLFPDVDAVEDRRKFTRIHKIVLQIMHVDLEKELLRDRSVIDDPDADGRTPLSWACGRGDSKSTEALLRHGASPNKPDRIGQGPLRKAMMASDPTCANLLLAYGASVDQRDNWEQTCLVSAMYYFDPVSFAKPLLKAGANPNVHESLGQTPLMEAVRDNKPDAVKLLLDHGAEPDRVNKAGESALHIGVHYNSHESLRVLLSNVEVDHSLQDFGKRTVMHWAAEFADHETLGLLRHERLEGLHADDQDESGHTAIDIAEKRRDRETARGDEFNRVDSSWISAFSDLLESLMAFSTPKSVLSYTGSVVSVDFFVDALHDLSLDQMTELAEDGKVPHANMGADHVEMVDFAV